MTYPDVNGDGIPDVFENRRPITEILEEAERLEIGATEGTAIIEIESQPRSPREGEIFLINNTFYRAIRNMSYTVLIVREVISGSVDVYPFR